METTYSFWGTLQLAFDRVWDAFAFFLPKLLGAIIVFVVGWIIAVLLGNLVKRVILVLHIDDLVAKIKIHDAFERAGLKLSIAGLLGWLVKWFLILVFLIAAADILEWQQVNDFLKAVVWYLPNVIIAAVILVVGLIVADFTREVVFKAVRATQLAYAGFAAGIAKWAILIFALMAALVQLNVATTLIHMLFQGLVAMLALAAGLAFGLGGKESAARFLGRIGKDLSSKE